jgi:histidinol phosphatase-like enzyme
MSKVAIIDFDGTIVEHKFPEIGDPMPGAFEVMKELQVAGWSLILFTCRENYGHKINKQYLKEAVDFCKENGVEFDAVNEALDECEFRPEDCLKRKPYGSVMIDDRNLGGFPGWEVVRKLLLEGKEYHWHVDE